MASYWPRNLPRHRFAGERAAVHADEPSDYERRTGVANATGQVQLDDNDPSINEAWLAVLKEEKPSMEEAFGGALDWRGPDASELMTKRTKVVTPRVSIGERSDPTKEGLENLAATARRLLDAVKPYLAESYDRALAAADNA
jgi:hypothetical protein